MHIDIYKTYGSICLYIYKHMEVKVRRTFCSLHRRHNDHDGVLNHQPHGCLLNLLFVSLNTLRALMIIPIPLDILPQIYSQWACQFSLLSKMTPRNFVCVTSSILWPSILIQFILREKPFGVNNIKLVFSMFRESLFTLTHVWILTSSTLISLTRISNLSLVQNKLVSSANNIGMNKLETIGKSFI